MIATFRSLAVLSLAVGTVVGCGFLGDFIPQPDTTVRLVNNGDFDVRVTVVFDDDQNALREALLEFGTTLEFTIPPGESTSFSRDCDQVQAITIERAELRVIGQVGPEASSAVLRDGSDFGCGDVIVYTFDHSDILIDFDVSTSVQAN